MKKIYYIFVALLFTVQGLFASEYYENKVVGNIEITVENLKNDVSFDTNSLINRLKTQKGSFFSQTVFDSDLKLLADDFDQIDPQIELKNDEVFINIKVWLRPTIRAIEWHGNEYVKTKTLQKELKVNIRSIFNKYQFNQSINKVKEYYIKNGYFESQVTYTVTEVPSTNEVDIAVNVIEGKSGKVKKIEFEGFESDDISAVLDMIQTKKYNFFISWITGTGIFTKEAMDHDQLMIVNYLQNKGYADAKVDIKIIDDPFSDKIIIQIIASKGPLYHFGKISYDGNSLVPDEDIQSHFFIRPGDVYSIDKIRETVQMIKDLYGHKGYIDAQVNFDTTILENEPIYNVHFQIEEGKCYKIGLIKIFGNVRTQTKVILRESLLVPGEKFDANKLKATQIRLQNIGYFKNVNVYAAQSSDSTLGSEYRDVHIEVEEDNTGHISLFSSFNSTENISFGIDLSETNFNYSGFREMFKEGPSSFRGGGEYLQLKTKFGKRDQEGVITWMTPYFRDTLWRFGLDLSATASNLQAKSIHVYTQGFSVFASYPLTNFWNAGTKYRFRNSENHIKGKTELTERDTDGVVSGISGSLSYDSTDNSYKAHRGYRSWLEAEYIGVGGSFYFLKYSYTNSYYYPVWAKGTLKYRADFKFIQSLSSPKSHNVPYSERYFLGGETTVRGYKPFHIGPRMQGTDSDPKGGLTSILLSMEYAQEIVRVADIFFFFDVGSITFKTFQPNHFNASAGAGLRLEIMNRVPITVGWGYPINPQRHSDRQSVFFSMGASF